MSGTLDIRDNVSWMPAGWVFDNVLQDVAAELRRSAAPLAAALSHAQTEVGGGYFDLRSLEADRFRALRGSAERAYELVVRDGPHAFRAPAMYPDLMRAFSTLKALLRTDQRAGEPDIRPGTLRINRRMSWSSVWWTFDLLLEQAAALLRQRDEILSGLLIGARSRSGTGLADLRDLDAARFGSFHDAVEFIHVRQTHAPEAHAPAFYELVNERTADLLRLLRSDERARARKSSGPPSPAEKGLTPIGVDPRTGRSRPLEAEAGRHLEEKLAQQPDGRGRSDEC